MGKLFQTLTRNLTKLRPDTTRWTARHNTVRAHAEAWHVYDKEFRSEQKGLVGITLNTDWVQPITPNDQGAADVSS